jgi:hypothetical protein
MKRLWYVAVVGLLFGGACGSDDDGDDGDDGASDTTEAPADDPADGDTTTSEGSASGGCPDETSLEIVTGDGGSTELDVVTGWGDEGPHPDNTVDYDGSLSLVFADYEIPIDEQFGYSIPIAGSEVATDGTELQISLALDGTIEGGQTFVDQTADAEVLAEHDGVINFISLFEPAERAVLGETTVTITEITDDEVCGEIAGVSETDLQSLTAVEGVFVVDRIQALEATEGQEE